MGDNPHLVTHFMAAGAGQRLDDYHFLRHTYETISGQEAQLNRILRMLDEDEIALNWRVDLTPIGRARSRSVYEFDRFGDAMALPGRIAYQRLRESERDDLKRQAVTPSLSRRNQPRRPRLSEQLDPLSGSDQASGSTPSAARLRALAEYEAALAESDAKRKQKAKEDQLQAADLRSFTIRHGKRPSSDGSSADRDAAGHLLCEWQLPNLSSSPTGLDYLTVEWQSGDQSWAPIGERIDGSQNQLQLDVASLTSADRSARFRLKAHLRNGTTVTSEPTDDISMDWMGSITPDVEVLSATSVQLSWKNADELNSKFYDIEKREGSQWVKVRQIQLEQGSARIDDLVDAQQCQFRLMPSASDPPMRTDEIEPDVFTVQNVNEWLSSLSLVASSSSTVDVNISEDGFKEFDRYKVEYSLIDRPDEWEQMSDILRADPHLTIKNLKQGMDYKFRLTPVPCGATAISDPNASQLSLVLDVKMPSTKKAKLVKETVKQAAAPPQFAIHQVDPTSVFIEAVVPADRPASFDDVFDIYAKKESTNDEWVKIGTIDKDHLSVTIKNLEENTGYAFNISNRNAPSSDRQSNVMQEFKFETASVKQYDPSAFLQKVEQSLESVVNGVMRAAAGHQALDDPVNISLNQVIKEIFHDGTLVPNEQYGFDTMALSNDLQLFRGPKQMMLQDLNVNETGDASKTFGEIIIHNYRRSEREQQPVIVREENGNTRIGNIDGDVIVRNVVTDVLLTNEDTRNQLSMNIVGQAFLKSVQGVLVVSNFKGIIVVKSVNKS